MWQLRRQHQAELARQKNEETARRLASGGLGAGDGQGPNRTTGDITAYRNVDDIPSRELKIHVSIATSNPQGEIQEIWPLEYYFPQSRYILTAYLMLRRTTTSGEFIDCTLHQSLI